MEVGLFKDTDSAIGKLTEDLIKCVDAFKNSPEFAAGKKFNFVLAGGSTAKKVFDHWVSKDSGKIDWNLLNFYWVDVRCVPDSSPRNHFSLANSHLIQLLKLPESSYFRIHGDRDPMMEAIRYEGVIRDNVPTAGELNLPRFDAVLLGISADYTTASLFANNVTLLTDKRLVAVSTHPVTKAVRITLTGMPILNAKKIFVPVFGAQKREMVKSLIEHRAPDCMPAPYILNRAKDATLYTDCIN